MKYIIIGLFVLLLIGCSTVTESSPTDNIDEVYLGKVRLERDVYSTDIYRFVDDEYNVVCWGVSGYRAAGLSCVPLSDLNGGD